MSNTLQALHASATDLAELVGTLTSDDLRAGAYPDAWTIADTLSHLGSGAVIMAGALDFALAGAPVPDDFMSPIWDEWNAKSPESQAGDLIVADQALLEAFAAVDEATGATLRFPMGDHDIDFATFVQHRLFEHVVHTWDVRVALEETATLLATAVPSLVDGVGGAGVVGVPIPDERTVVVHTVDPDRTFRLELGPDAVLVEPDADAGGDLDHLRLGAEAFVRLITGRLDVAHTPSDIDGTVDLDELRAIFTGY